MKTSVLLLTFNEEGNLPRCLSSLDWCDDIVIVDSGSTDATVSIAKKFGARVLTRTFDNFASQRNFGLDNGELKNDWILHLDADEVLTAEFRLALEELKPVQGIYAYKVPSKTMMNDHWLRFSGMYPTYQVRLGHRDRLRFKQVGHGQWEDLPSSCIGTFDQPYLHYNFSHGLSAWLRKHVRYAEDEAGLIVQSRLGEYTSSASLLSPNGTVRRRALKELSNRIPYLLRPFARFLYVYFWRQGFRDGRYGVLYGLMLAVYEGMIAIIVYERLLNRR